MKEQIQEVIKKLQDLNDLEVLLECSAELNMIYNNSNKDLDLKEKLKNKMFEFIDRALSEQAVETELFLAPQIIEQLLKLLSSNA